MTYQTLLGGLEWMNDDPIFIRLRQFWIDCIIDNDLNGYMWNYWKGLREIWNKYYSNNHTEVAKDIKFERLLGFPILYLMMIGLSLDV